MSYTFKISGMQIAKAHSDVGDAAGERKVR